ncbi:DUF4424 family protein [Enterobacter kobei]|uniref:DUF4424 family protein n=2 Tax=Enterobacter kobei TaxID=208224 RepID=A0AAW3XGJ6_9ENTR|nr:DUF4424 family protein [Enterobacter kobei]ELE9246776.1 DUF4424 family protein [Enterobacter kobei]ELJ5853885.1 DUF4424 family protein [Enterobacter kobei]KJM91575.1 hypothetical protein SS33_12205 [Enterobacter kobei]MBC6322984.1 DUF4424 family protein [Enterobacter kobei]MBG0682470.1 DUF4424 family protein [Enterobacter kobei]
MANFKWLAALLFIITSNTVSANDSAVGETNGSIEFLKQNEISMAKERLLIASDRINVDYVFINHSAQDITVPVAFPMPAISKDAGQDHSPGIANFKISVDGKPVNSTSRWRVMRTNENFEEVEDVTAKVLQSGWTIPQLIELLVNDSPFENNDEQGKPRLPPEWLNDGYPHIAVQQYFIWQQRFPAGKEIMIRHSYTPSFSGGVPQNLTGILGDEYGDECLTPATRKALKQLDAGIKERNEDGSANIGWGILSYILKTGANWKDGVIGDFTLRIHKSQENEVVVPCFSYPLKQIDPLTMEFKQKNFKPDNNLDIHFYYDSLR